MAYIAPAWLTWAYRPPDPNVTPGPGAIPECSEVRARLVAGGLFFRSVLAGQAANQISVGLAINSGTATLSVYRLGVLVATYQSDAPVTSPTTTTSTTGSGSNTSTTTTTIPAVPQTAINLRAALLGSAYLEMPDRGTDSADKGGTDPANPDPFPPTAFTGGSGLPLNAAGIATGCVFHTLIFMRYSERGGDAKPQGFNAYFTWVGNAVDDPNGYWRLLDDSIGGPVARVPSPYDDNVPFATLTTAFPSSS